MRWSSRRRSAPREGRPALSIVVPVYAVEDYLERCLVSLRRQGLDDVEIVVVDDGSPDGSLRIAQRHAKKDPRIVIVQQENAGLGAARNAGVAAATGEFLTFVDSDDEVRGPGYALAVTSLRTSGAAFAVLPYTRLHASGRTAQPAWIADLYATPRVAVDITTYPQLLVHATAWSKVYRRSFWDEGGFSFPVGVLYEDQEVTTQTHAAAIEAGGVDVVPVLTYLWRVREQSITREFSAATIEAFLGAVLRSLEVLPVPARRERARQVLSNDVPHYVRAVARGAEDAFAAALGRGVAALLAETEPGELALECPAEMRAAYTWLVAGDVAGARAFLDGEGLVVATHDGGVVDGEPTITVPTRTHPEGEPLVLSQRQTPLDATALRAVVGPDSVDVHVWGYLRHVESPDLSSRAWLVRGEQRLTELTVARSDEKPGDRLRATRACNDEAVWVVTVPVSELDADGAALRLELEVTHAGRTRTAVVENVDAGGSAAAVQPVGETGWTVGGAPFRLERDREPSAVGPVDHVVLDGAALTLRAGPAAAASTNVRPGSVESFEERPSASLLAELPLRLRSDQVVVHVVLTATGSLGVEAREPLPHEQLTVYGTR